MHAHKIDDGIDGEGENVPEPESLCSHGWHDQIGSTQNKAKWQTNGSVGKQTGDGNGTCVIVPAQNAAADALQCIDNLIGCTVKQERAGQSRDLCVVAVEGRYRSTQAESECNAQAGKAKTDEENSMR